MRNGRTKSARSIASVGVAAVLAVGLAACASSTGGAGAGSGATATTTPPGAATSSAPASTRSVVRPGHGSTSSAALTVTVGEAENGTTLTVNRGADVIVTLHSTYWQFQQASAPKVLVEASPVIQGDPPNRAGIPGSGKGTARETYHARTAGTATITALRTTCGEAMRCTAAQSVYRITVIVQ